MATSEKIVLGERTVIMIDDDQDHLAVTKFTVEKLGYDCVCFDRIDKAMHSLFHESVGLPMMIISDVMMPDGDGLDLLTAVRFERRYDSVPFYFLTSANRMVFQTLLKSQKYDGIINKPLDQAVLIRLLTAQMLISKDAPNLKSEIIEQSLSRRHKRKKENLRVVSQLNGRTVFGDVYEISSGGMGLCLHEQNLQLGQELVIHCFGNKRVPEFNAVCKVVFIMNSAKADGDGVIQKQAENKVCGLSFLSMSHSVFERIDNFIKVS